MRYRLTIDNLKISEQKFRGVFDNSSNAIFIHDLKGNILEINEIACKRLGFTRKEMMKLNIREIDNSEFARFVPE